MFVEDVLTQVVVVASLERVLSAEYEVQNDSKSPYIYALGIALELSDLLGSQAIQL